MPQWITTADVARAMSVSESTVRWLAREGKIVGRKHEGSWRFTLDSVRAYMAGVTMNLPLSSFPRWRQLTTLLPSALSRSPMVADSRLACASTHSSLPTPYPASLTAVGILFADRRQHSAGRMLSGTTEHVRTDPGCLAGWCWRMWRQRTQWIPAWQRKGLDEPPIRFLELDYQSHPRGWRHMRP